MRVPKIYLETTLFNFYFTDDAPDKKQDTLKLFEEIRQGKYEPYASEDVVRELLDTSDSDKKIKMTQLVNDYGITLLPSSAEAEALADIYVKEGVIPLKYRTDGVHIALTAVFNLDFIISYNFKHIVKRKTIEMTELINYRAGYKKVGIYSPAEVVEDVE
jgi:hypothetical protein